MNDQRTSFFAFAVVAFWCSIRVAVAFVGFLGMIAHYSQKINVGLALVCMVNHSAIASPANLPVVSNAPESSDCPVLESSSKIVNSVASEFQTPISLPLTFRKGPTVGQKILRD